MSKNTLKWIRTLKDRKARQENQMFVVEGEKSVCELLESSWLINNILCTNFFLEKHQNLIQTYSQKQPTSLLLLKTAELEQISQLENNKMAMAVVKMPPKVLLPPQKGFSLYLDHIQDPGNLGTIVRIADWYGLSDLFCSPDTVDVFNSKSIAASMGSFLRVHTHYVENSWLESYPYRIYGALMEGKNLHETRLDANSLVIIGNEGHGIRPNALSLVQTPLTIPKFGAAESLNAGIAAAIICDNFKRASF